MSRFVGTPFALMAFALMAFVLLPAATYAQGSIAGSVRDSSGAVLPGVTVEASSPALIEKTRTVVTDGTGQYKIVDLRPGTYAVTFTLSGFSTVKREGIELAGSFAATVNAGHEGRRRPGNDHRDRRLADRGRPELRPTTRAWRRRHRRHPDLEDAVHDRRADPRA